MVFAVTGLCIACPVWKRKDAALTAIPLSTAVQTNCSAATAAGTTGTISRKAFFVKAAPPYWGYLKRITAS
jgi:hypothetical protein